jgi:branched-chain amino acid transport system substrate-binding protein
LPEVNPKEGRRRFLKYIAAGIGVAVVAGVGGWYLTTPKKAVQQGNVVFGYYGPLSGNYALPGLQELNGLTLAVEEINAKGGVLGGRNVAIIARDDGANGDTAVAKAHELAGSGAVMMYGGISDAEGLAVAPFANQQHVCQIGQIGSDDLFGKHCQWYSFSGYMRNSAITKTALETLYKPGVVDKDTFILAPDYVWGHDVNDSFVGQAPAYGVNYIGTEYIPFAAPDMTPYLAKAKDSGAKTIYAIEYGSDLVNMMNAYHNLQIPQKLVVATSTYATYHTIPQEALYNTYMLLLWWYRLPNDQNVAAFVEKFRSRYGITASYDNEIGYNCGWNTADAIDMAGSDKPDDFIPKLEGMQFTRTRSKPEQYRACDHCVVHDMYAVQGKAPGDMADPDDHWIPISTAAAEDIVMSCQQSGCVFPNKPA